MANWKTTLTGCIFAVGNVVLPMLQGNSVTPKDILISAGLAALGFLSKDFNVTGGTKTQPTVVNVPTIPSEPIKAP
jgi:hypothetical protein